jgi:hypothetical protein
VGEGGDVLGGQLHQVLTLQRVFRGPHNALGHVPQQVFPQLQVAGGGRMAISLPSARRVTALQCT